MHTDRSLQLNDILQLKQQDSLPALRECIVRLKSKVSVPIEGDAPSRRYVIEELDQIAGSQTLERARYYLKRLEKGLTETRTSALNDINLNRWKEYDDLLTDSLWILKKRDSTGVHHAGYWGNFIPQIPNQMIRRYTKAGDWVLEAFLGSGTTLIESQRLGRNGIGIELQPQVLAHAQALLEREPNPHGVVSDLILGDSSTADVGAALRRHGRESVQLLMMHPPYFDIIRFSQDQRCLSNAASVEHFLDRLMAVVANTAPFLERGRYFVLVIGDKYQDGEWIPLGYYAMHRIMEMGFSLKSIIVKNFEETTGKRQQKELWKYRALVGGFYIFKHEYIFLFRKR